MSRVKGPLSYRQRIERAKRILRSRYGIRFAFNVPACCRTCAWDIVDARYPREYVGAYTNSSQGGQVRWAPDGSVLGAGPADAVLVGYDGEAVGHVVTAVLRDQGLTVEWNGNGKERLRLLLSLADPTMGTLTNNCDSLPAEVLEGVTQRQLAADELRARKQAELDAALRAANLLTNPAAGLRGPASSMDSLVPLPRAVPGTSDEAATQQEEAKRRREARARGEDAYRAAMILYGPKAFRRVGFGICGALVACLLGGVLLGDTWYLLIGPGILVAVLLSGEATTTKPRRRDFGLD